jgi:hypothetical protein
MRQAGMRWKMEGSANVIAVRTLVITAGRWKEFWNTIMRNVVYQKLMGNSAR